MAYPNILAASRQFVNICEYFSEKSVYTKNYSKKRRGPDHMTTKQKITQAMVLDAISRAALTLDRADPAQAQLQQLLNEFRRTLLQTNGQTATTVLYQSKLVGYLLQHTTDYPTTVTTLMTLLAQFVKQTN